MTKKVQRKGRIMEGFPKLAFYTGDKRVTHNFPKDSKSWWDTISHTIEIGELVVIVALNKRATLYDPKKGYYKWDTPAYYYVPVSLLVKGIVPITSIYNWKRSYNRFPLRDIEEFKLIQREDKEIGKEFTQAAAAI